MILQPSDALIASIQKYQAGDQAAFDTIYYESIRYVTKSVLNVLNRVAPEATEELQQDIIQDTYMTIIAKLDTLQDPKAFLQWAGRIATRHAEHSWRKDIRLHQVEQAEDASLYEIPDDDFIPEDILFNKERQAQIRRILDTLPINQYLCVVEYYYNGLKEVEVALKLGMPVNTVKTNLARARKKLRGAIETEEKRSGVKLYSMSWMLLTIFSEDVLNMLVNVEQDAKLLESLHEKIAAGATVLAAGAAAEGTSAAAAGGSLLGKIIAGILAGALTVGGVVGGIHQIQQISSEPTYAAPTQPTEPILPCALTYTLVDAHTDADIQAHTYRVINLQLGTAETYEGSGTVTINLTSQYEYVIEISAPGYRVGSFQYVPRSNGLDYRHTVKMSPLPVDISGEEIANLEKLAQTLPQLDQWEAYLLADDENVSNKLWEALANAVHQGELIKRQETSWNAEPCYAFRREDAIRFLLNAYGAAPHDIEHGTYGAIFENDGTMMYMSKPKQDVRCSATLTYIGRTTIRRTSDRGAHYSVYNVRFYVDQYEDGQLREDGRVYISAEVCPAPDSEYGWIIVSYSLDERGALREVLPRSANGGMQAHQSYRDVEYLMPEEAAVYAEHFLGLEEGKHYGVGMDTDAQCGIRLIGSYNMGDHSVYKFLFWERDQILGAHISGKIIEVDKQDGTIYDENFKPGDLYVDFTYTPVDEMTGHVIGPHTLTIRYCVNDHTETYELTGANTISLVVGRDYEFTIRADGYAEKMVHVCIEQNCDDPSMEIMLMHEKHIRPYLSAEQIKLLESAARSMDAPYTDMRYSLNGDFESVHAFLWYALENAVHDGAHIPRWQEVIDGKPYYVFTTAAAKRYFLHVFGVLPVDIETAAYGKIVYNDGSVMRMEMAETNITSTATLISFTKGEHGYHGFSFFIDYYIDGILQADARKYLFAIGYPAPDSAIGWTFTYVSDWENEQEGITILPRDESGGMLGDKSGWADADRYLTVEEAAAFAAEYWGVDVKQYYNAQLDSPLGCGIRLVQSELRLNGVEVYRFMLWYSDPSKEGTYVAAKFVTVSCLDGKIQ